MIFTTDVRGPGGRRLHARIVADPFRVINYVNVTVDECRRRIHSEIVAHREHRDGPLYRIHRLLTMAAKRLDETGEAKMVVDCALAVATVRSPQRATRRGRSTNSAPIPTHNSLPSGSTN